MTLRVHGLGQLLTLLPFQFGFSPERSVVVVLMEGAEIAGLLRFDDVACGGGLVPGAVRLVTEAATGAGATNVLVVAYRVEPGTVCAQAVADDVEGAGLVVGHVLHLAGEVWWASRCGRGCCDGELRQLPAVHEVPAAVDFVGRGVHPAETKEAAVAALYAVDAQACADVESRIAQAHGSRAAEREETELRVAWQTALASGRAMTPELLAGVVVAFGEPQRRDRLVWGVVPELALEGMAPRGESVDASAALATLTASVASVPAQGRGVWLVLVALARWRAGDGCGASLSARAAVDHAPQLPLARLVLQLVASGVSYERFAGYRPPSGMHEAFV